MADFLSHTVQKIKTSRKELTVQIICVFIIPIFLFDLKIIPIQNRVPALIFIVSILLFILIKERWTLSMLGANKSSFDFKKYAIPYIFFTGVAVLLIVTFGEKIGHEEFAQWWTQPHFLYLFFVVSLFQEIAYRGYLIPALGKLTKNRPLLIITNTLLFTFLHTIFPNLSISLPIAFIGGLFFALMYVKYPSLPFIIICHAILNFCAVLYGFFVIPGITH